MKKIIIILLTTIICVFTSCTQQAVSRQFGGTVTIKLDPGEKLVEATWKDDNLWYLVEPMDSNYIPTTKVFKENASFGIMNGKVIFIETR